MKTLGLTGCTMYEQKSSSHPAISSIWRAIVATPAEYTDPANEFWGIAFTKNAGNAIAAELVGPSLQSRTVASKEGDEYWGIEFCSHVIIADVSKASILGASTSLPMNQGGVIFDGRSYGVPAYDELESFVDRLLDDGVLYSREDVRRSLGGDTTGYSPRSWQRHIRWVTGLSKKQIEQLERARHAYFLLQKGKSLKEAAFEAGYSDQAHMTRSLKLLRSETPAQIIARHVSR